MKLSELFKGIATEPATTRAKGEATGVTSDSRSVKKGDVFVAVPGTAADGAQFALDAQKAGAIAVVAERAIAGLTIPLFKVPSARKALALLAGNLFGNPARELAIIGVTGTNGKTTTAWLLESMLEAGGASVGLLGTIAVRYAGNTEPPSHTTPDPVALHQTFRNMVDAGVDTVVMEVSSHALHQDRVHGVSFRSAAFTNLSRDHLDYHKDMESYFQAKRLLFTENLSQGGVAVVNGDDTAANRIYSEQRQQGRMAWKFSRTGAGEVGAAGVELSPSGMRGTLKTPAGDIPLKSKLVGSHNLENILCATGLALACGYSRRDVQDGIERVSRVPGRMESLSHKGVTVLVDYAHTDEALSRALESARDITRGKLLVVFGCGGDRDAGKRPLMGEAAAKADLPVVTSDNPRSEDPDEIITQVLPGLEKAGLRRMSFAKARTGEAGYLVESDRAQAIALAVSLAKDGDTVVVAGKGHEQTQEIAGQKAAFDDLSVARTALGMEAAG